MLDLTKPLSTQDGTPVTLITTRGRAVRPLVGYLGESAIPYSWKSDGTDGDPLSGYDLINTPESKRGGEVWVDVYEDAGTITYGVRANSEPSKWSKRLAYVRVPWT